MAKTELSEAAGLAKTQSSLAPAPTKIDKNKRRKNRVRLTMLRKKKQQRVANNVAEPTGLLQLPQELRQKIFGFLFEETTIKPQKTRSEDGKYVCGKGLVGLSLACGQLYVEIIGFGLLYQLGTFEFDCAHLMMSYLKDITPIRRESIREVCLTLAITSESWKLPKGTFQTLATLKSLERLTIKLDVAEHLRRLAGRRFSQRRYHVSGEIALGIVLKADWDWLTGLKKFEMMLVNSNGGRFAPSHGNQQKTKRTVEGIINWRVLKQ